LRTFSSRRGITQTRLHESACGLPCIGLIVGRRIIIRVRRGVATDLHPARNRWRSEQNVSLPARIRAKPGSVRYFARSGFRMRTEPRDRASRSRRPPGREPGGFFQLMKERAEALRRGQTESGPPVRLHAPPGISAVQLLSGLRLTVAPTALSRWGRATPLRCCVEGGKGWMVATPTAEVNNRAKRSFRAHSFAPVRPRGQREDENLGLGAAAAPAKPNPLEPHYEVRVQVSRSLCPHLVCRRKRTEVKRRVLLDAVAARQLRDIPAAAQRLDQRGTRD